MENWEGFKIIIYDNFAGKLQNFYFTEGSSYRLLEYFTTLCKYYDDKYIRNSPMKNPRKYLDSAGGNLT